jgi:hypothetical protein
MGSEKVSREISSAMGSLTVSSSDSTVYDPPGRALYVGTGGSLAVRMAGDGSTPTLTNVPNGTLLPIAVDKVLSTGTSASDIVLFR